MQNLRRAIVWSALVGSLLPAGLLAERTRFWRQSTYEEFEKGTAKGVALRSDGKLVLAPRFAPFGDANTAYLWVLRVDSKGRLYAAGGSNAKVLRFDEKGTATAVFESEELAAQALAIDAQDNLYVGTSPDGKVYKVTPDGKTSVYFEPGTKYIWDLAVDAAGTLYVATGDKGEVFAVSKDGKGETYYKSEETHARALALDAKGNLLIGTDPGGLIVRVEKNQKAEDRRGFVIYEAEKKEVTSLALDRAGNLYAAAVGEKPRTTPQPQQVPQPVVTTQVQVSSTTTQVQAVQPQQVRPQAPVTTFLPFPSRTGGSAVYRIGPEGAPEELWDSREDLVYTLAVAPSGKLLLGTGNKGTLIQLEGNDIFSNLAKTASAQVTGLAVAPDGRVFVGTSNPGQVFALGPDAEPEGAFESEPFDTKIFSQWGRLTWWGENGSAGSPVSFYVRTGNTSNPDKNWSEWSGPYANLKGEDVKSPAARFAQWKAVFKAGQGETPNIAWVSLAYLPKNVAPTIDDILIQDPGVRVQGFAGTPQQQQQLQPVQLRLPTPPNVRTRGARPRPPQQPTPPRFDPPPQGFAQQGYQGVVWSAQDDNEDDLTFTVFFRAEGEKNWKVLKDKLDQKLYSWDTNTLPDGAYYLKIVASDAPSNPPGEGLTAERESDRFEVDNTPPTVEVLERQSRNPETKVRFVARDSYSNIARAEYSLNAGDWQLVFPLDRTADAPEETYEITLGDLAPGEHTLTVRVYDRFENSTTAKVTLSGGPIRKK